MIRKKTWKKEEDKWVKYAKEKELKKRKIK